MKQTPFSGRDDAELGKRRIFGDITSVNPAMHEAFFRCARAAPHDATVMLLGESGTGKRTFAEEIHRRSSRSNEPLYTFDSASVSESLIESHLFGHVRGAFTDAAEERVGVFEQAAGATLYITGLAELSEAVQVRFLRVVQEGSVTPIGSSVPRDVDVRLIVAAPPDIESRVSGGRFREDLYYRLAVITALLPPLRERMDDLTLLVRQRLEEAAPRTMSTPQLTSGAMQSLRDHSWPGNLRELRNALDRALVLADSEVLDASDFAWLGGSSTAPIGPTLDSIVGASVRSTFSIPAWSRAIERHLIRAALDETSQNRTKAAAILEISRRALQYKIKEYFPEDAVALSSKQPQEGDSGLSQPGTRPCHNEENSD